MDKATYKKNKKNKCLSQFYIFLGISIILLLSLVFSAPLENLINNTGIFHSRDFVESTFKIHYIDVGQGDCSFVQVGDYSVLIDTGTKTSTKDVIAYLNALGIKSGGKIDFLILTHTDSDHVGGAESILDEFEFKNIYIPKMYSNFDVENGFDTENYKLSTSNLWYKVTEKIYEEVDSEHKFYSFAGMSFECGKGSFEFFTPLKDRYDTSNDYSPILIFECDGVKAMFVGDASRDIEEDFLSQYSSGVSTNYFDCDVLKVGHHGSKTSTSSEFLQVIKPEIAVVSCGVNNSYNHPSNEAINRLNEFDCTILRTDIDGSIVLYGSNGIFQIEECVFGQDFYFKWWYAVVSGMAVCFATTIFTVFTKKEMTK